jgi:hypothetical protein
MVKSTDKQNADARGKPILQNTQDNTNVQKFAL